MVRVAIIDTFNLMKDKAFVITVEKYWEKFWAEKYNPIRETDKVYIFCSQKNNFSPESLKMF